jgi:menaquinone-dependent protoporphyrinogen IX oxidase
VKALIVYATRKGWTKRTAEVLADELEEKGYVTDCFENKLPSQKELLTYDLVVVGTSIMIGRWKVRPRLFLKKFGPGIANLSIWVSAAGTLFVESDEGRGLKEATQVAVEKYIKPLVEKYKLHPRYMTAFGGQISWNAETVRNNWNSNDIRTWARLIAA